MPEPIAFWIVLAVLLLMLAVGIRLAVKGIRNRYGRIKTVKTTVIDKHKTQMFSKYAGSGKREKFVIVFLAEGKKRAFYVSEFSYGGYRLQETGTLRYQGNKLIDFH